MGASSAKFSAPPSGKTMDGTQKRFKMMARTTSITMQNLVKIERRTSAWEDEMWCFSLFLFFFSFFFVYNAPQITVASDLVTLLQQEIVLVFVGRFRCGLHLFRGRKALSSLWKRFENHRWRYDTCRNDRENCQNLRKWVQSLCAAHHFDHSKARWKKTSTTTFYPTYCRCAPI